MPHEEPKIGWIEADKNPWGIRLLDVRAVTQAHDRCAADRRKFAGAVPELQPVRVISWPSA